MIVIGSDLLEIYKYDKLVLYLYLSLAIITKYVLAFYT